MPKCDVKTRYIPATFAWTLLLLATTLFFYYPAQYYIRDYLWVLICQGVITFFVLANFTLATFMDPGVIPKAPPDEDREDDFRAPLYKNIEVNGITVRMKWCVTCKFYRPPRCSHCSVCNHCIETFDHHCPWVNNCIGRRNYRFFFFFLISLSIHMISIFTLSLIYVLNYKAEYSDIEPIIAMVLMSLVILLAIPIFGLTGFHMVLVSRGRTTNEQVTGKFKGGYNPFSRGCWENCCYTQFGPQFPSLIRPHKYKVKRKHCSHGPIATITNDSQVKTYMDNSNGVRNINSNAYNKLSPGRDGCELDMEPSASQSQDCEPTPPLQRHGSKSNFFLPVLDGGSGVGGGGGGESPRQHNQPPRGGAGGGAPPTNVHHYPRSSPHPRPRGLAGAGGCDPNSMNMSNNNNSSTRDSPAVNLNNRSATPDGLGPQRPSPTMQQRIKALGVPTPLTLSASPVRRSNPSTPTQPRRPDFIGVSTNHHQYHQQQQQQSQVPSIGGGHHQYYDFQSAGAQHPGQSISVGGILGQQQQQQPQRLPPASANMIQTAGAGGYGGSPQRRFMSEGELVRQEAQQLSYPRSNNTVDNIRELANSPQRGVYMWKDTSPSGYAPPPLSQIMTGGGASHHQQHHPEFYRSNPTSPTQQQQQQSYNNSHSGSGAASSLASRPYHPAVRGGVAVYPPSSMPPQQGGSPQVHRKNPQQQQQQIGNAAQVDNRRRPMSFVRALEMSDGVELGGGGVSSSQQQQHQVPNNMQNPSAIGNSSNAKLQQPRPSTPDRTSVYDMNYEISV